jgi:hypothetical protein
MADDNTSNLPILDDIIVPGDADKAIPRPSHKAQSSLWDDAEATEDAAVEANAVEDSLADVITEEDSASETGPQAETPAAPAQEEQSPAPDEQTDTIEPAPAMTAEEDPAPGQPPVADPAGASLDRQDIESLTDEIMACMTPEIERILREKIRQVLETRFSGNPD